MSKIIIHNHTHMDDLEALRRIELIVADGKISKNKSQEEQYCHLTTLKDGLVVTCDKHNETYTFKIFKESVNNE